MPIGLYKVTQLGVVSALDIPLGLGCAAVETIAGLPVEEGAYLGDTYIISWDDANGWWTYTYPPTIPTGYTQSVSPYKTALGVNTQAAFWTSLYSTWMGYYSGYYNSTGNYSTGYGAYAGYYMYGTYNVCMGYRAGYSLACSGNSNILVGSNASVDSATTTTCIVIGDAETAKGSYTTLIGKTSFTATWIRGTAIRFGNEDAGDKYWYFQNSSSSNQPGFRWNNTDGRIQASKNGTNYADIPDRIVYDLHKNLATDTTGVATVIGADYIDASRWPATRTIKFRCVLETTNAAAGYEATADLFDTADSLAGGSPAPVSGSEVSSNALVATMVEATVTAAFAGFTGAGVFEARLWIATAGGGNTVTCKSAQLIVEW